MLFQSAAAVSSSVLARGQRSGASAWTSAPGATGSRDCPMGEDELNCSLFLSFLSLYEA